MAIGCIHPVRLLQLDQLTGKVYCRTCRHTLDNEVVAIRTEAFFQGSG